MQSLAQDEYLANDVMTATPQKLHLMVVEAALRASTRAKILSESKQDEAALTAILHGQKAIATLLAGLNYEAQSPLVRQIAATYMFIYKSLVNAQLGRDTSKLADAIRILELERETWRQVCEQYPSSQPPVRQEPIPAPLSRRITSLANDAASDSGFSCEA